MKKKEKTIRTRPVGLRTWVEIDQNKLQTNFDIIKNHIGSGPTIWAVAKSNAYGHSLLDYCESMAKIGLDGFCVDSITEALALRKAHIKAPILILGSTLEEKLEEAAAQNIAVTISTTDILREYLINKQQDHQGKTLNIHLKIDSGMHRQGFYNNKELLEILDLIKKNKNYIKLDGVYTHFASAKNPSFPAETKGQLKYFLESADIIKKAGFAPQLHSAATSASLLFPETRLDMVRIGIGMYGLWPSKETKAALETALPLSPALSWHTIISEVKKVKKGESVGYDFTETLARDSRIAVLPIGYWHGYPRALSGIGHVLIRGKRARVLGRVSMDMIVVDISDIPATMKGDIATLIGKNENQSIDAEQLADLAGTINYEIITRINPLIKRVYK